MKAERDAREKQRIKTARVSEKMLTKDVLWPLAQMHLGEDGYGRIHALQVCDGHSILTLSSSVGAPAYIEDVLGRISTTKAADIATLTPWAWAAARK